MSQLRFVLETAIIFRRQRFLPIQRKFTLAQNNRKSIKRIKCKVNYCI